MITNWIICYDICDDKIRRRVFLLLKNHAAAVQYSVFQARLNHQQQQDLRSQLAMIIETADSIRWYPLCQWCNDKAECSGQAVTAPDKGYYIV